ncbi:hypothetical protein ACJMK2_034594 [Sinanodonta woodiana]|uniref:tRNA-splicing endonuclease subunit Sen54 N-terminal domain-containing protein n=1 Tax=Sinanodonta woodiana TaxID=1069815 RepID=A0ABD3WS42_SINWO
MYTSLSGEELFRFRTPLDKSLPQKGGVKDFAPDGSWLQAKKLEKFYEERLQALSEPRVEKSSDLVKGEWNPEKCLVEFEKEKGKFWIHMGFVDVKRKWLYPEEALFLMETSVLEVWYRGLPISLQQACTFFLVGSLSMEQYQVYSHLRRIGYVVLRHQGRLNFTRYEKLLGLDKYANKKQRKRRQKGKQESPSGKKLDERTSSEICIKEKADIVAEDLYVSARKKAKIVTDLPCEKNQSTETSVTMDVSVTMDTNVTRETNEIKYKDLKNDIGIDESTDITSNDIGNQMNESSSCPSLDGVCHDSANTSLDNTVCDNADANRHKLDEECNETVYIAINLSNNRKGLTAGHIDKRKLICDASAAEVTDRYLNESLNSKENFQERLEDCSNGINDHLDTQSGKVAPDSGMWNHQGWYRAWYRADDFNKWYNLYSHNENSNQNLQTAEPDNSLHVVFESDLNQNLHDDVIFPDIVGKDVLVLKMPDDGLLPKNVNISENSLVFDVQNYHKTRLKTRDSRKGQNIPYLYELDFSYVEFMRPKFRGQAKSWKEYKECVKRWEIDASGFSPVQHLWQKSEEVVPLLRPEEAVSTAAVLQKLQIIQEVDVTKMCKWPHNKEISYDVYRPDLKFRKSQPGIPNHRICVVRSIDPPPSISEVSALYGYLDDDIPIHWAVVDNGEIAFYEFSPISLPTDITVG